MTTSKDIMITLESGNIFKWKEGINPYGFGKDHVFTFFGWQESCAKKCTIECSGKMIYFDKCGNKYADCWRVSENEHMIILIDSGFLTKRDFMI